MKPPDNSYQRMLSRMFDDSISSGKRLFFIQGMWRSGTSWLGRMIGSHPQVYVSHYELQSFMLGYEVKLFGGELNEQPFLDARYSAGRKMGFLSTLMHFHEAEKPTATLIGERSPGGDVKLIKENFPDSKMVTILRDGRDVCVSLAWLQKRTRKEVYLPDSEGKLRFDAEYLERVARLYATYVMDYFALKSEYPEDMLLIRYEDLLRETTSVMEDVFGFLNVATHREEVSDICREHSFSAESKRQPAEADVGSYLRKGSVGDWKNHFSEQCLSSFERFAGEALQLAGYEVSGGAKGGSP